MSKKVDLSLGEEVYVLKPARCSDLDGTGNRCALFEGGKCIATKKCVNPMYCTPDVVTKENKQRYEEEFGTNVFRTAVQVFERIKSGNIRLLEWVGV